MGGGGMSIKECPFCGFAESQIHNHVVTNHFRITGLDWFVQCSNCKAEGPGADSKEFAIKTWNEGTPRYHRVFKLEEALRRIIETRGDVPYDPNIHIACKRIAREALE
jgi:Lar family restriction alleviation protein